MKLSFLIISFLIYFIPAQACLNGGKELITGGVVYNDYMYYAYPMPYGHTFHKERYNGFLITLQKKYEKTKDLDYLSDKGLVLILQGKYQEAINLYLEIEKIKPNRYATASNIGTAYELIGDNQNALKWINKSIQINPNAHDDSEWIHAKILEAKIKGDAYITSSFLINTDFGLDEKPTTNLSTEELKKLEKSLYYQLNERISFIKKKDAIVAILLFDLGNVVFLNNNTGTARALYKKAQTYGFSDSLIEQRIQAIHKLTKMEEEKLRLERKLDSIKIPVINFQNIFPKEEFFILPEYYLYILSICLFCGVLIFLFRKKNQKT